MKHVAYDMKRETEATENHIEFHGTQFRDIDETPVSCWNAVCTALCNLNLSVASNFRFMFHETDFSNVYRA